MILLSRAASAVASIVANGNRSFSSKTRWGIISAGKISSDFTKAISITDGAEAASIAARSPKSSAQFAKDHSIAQTHPTYESLIEDPDIDVVYIGSIADHHASITKKALLANKPVVVEKPLTCSLAETMELISLAKSQDVFLMEGMWTRCFPAMKLVSDLISSNEIGDIVVVQGDFGWNTKDCEYPSDRMWNLKSGGMTLDIGMYMAQLGTIAYPRSKNWNVERVQAMGTKKHGVDQTVLANIMYDNDNSDDKGMLQFYVTGGANTEERVTIQGTKGRIVIDPDAHVPTRVRLIKDEGRTDNSDNEMVYDFPLPDDTFGAPWNYPGSVGFTHQIKEVGDALKRGEKECGLFTLEDSMQTAMILDEILNQVHEKSDAKEENVVLEVPTYSRDAA